MNNAQYFQANSQISRYIVSFEVADLTDDGIVKKTKGTGVILTENWILTAGHVEPYGATIHFYKDSQRSGETRTIIDQYWPPGLDNYYYDAQKKKQMDVRLVKMDRPIPLGSDYRSVKLITDLASERKNLSGWAAGAGDHDGAPNPNALLKWSDAKVTDDLSQGAVLVIDAEPNQGDSGGPFMRSYPTNNFELIGVMATVAGRKSKVVYVGDPDVRAWINSIVPEYTWRDFGAIYGPN